MNNDTNIGLTGNIRAPKADRRRAAYRNRMAKHLEHLRQNDRKNGLLGGV